MKRSMRWSGGLVVLASTAGLLVAGSGVAAADSGASTPRSESAVCTQRIPAVLDRIDRLTDRINGDAGTRGSTAWLKAKSGQAREAGFVALADLLDSRADARPQRLDALAGLKGEVQDVQTEDCAT
jgi:uncharacterized protein YfaQ (DUF2300 family)